LAITFRWSGDHGRLKVSGKYASQKFTRQMKVGFRWEAGRVVDAE
jgi:hypothetical protein